MRMLAKVHVLDSQLPRLRDLSSYLKRSRTAILQSFKIPKVAPEHHGAEHDADIGYGHAKRSLGASRATWSDRNDGEDASVMKSKTPCVMSAATAQPIGQSNTMAVCLK